MVQSYRDLKVWQKAMDLVTACYGATQAFPRSEIYGLTSQLRRAAVSVPANIAEGRGRQHKPEWVQHLFIASGSLAELETHILIAQRLAYLQEPQTQQLLEQCREVGQLLNGLIRSLRSDSSSRHPTPGT